MPAAVKRAASTVTVKAGKSLKSPAAAKNDKHLKATGNTSFAREEARRKWGVETGAVRSVHARKF